MILHHISIMTKENIVVLVKVHDYGLINLFFLLYGG